MDSVLLVHPADSRFCDVTWEGLQVEIVEGDAGTEGEVVQRTFVSVAEAQEFVADLLAERRAQGFCEGTLETAPAPSEESEEIAALVAHITEDPEDEARYLVLADCLQQVGHPRGQLIVLQHALEQDPSDERRAAVDELLTRYRLELLGDLADDPELVDVTFRLGFAERVHLFARAPESEDLDVKAVTRGFLAHPTCRLLGRLVLALPDSLPSELIAGAVAAPPMPTVRFLQLGAPESYASRLRVPSGLTQVFPSLKELAVFGSGEVVFEAAEFSALESLVLWGRLQHATTALERCSFPSLKRIAIGGTSYDIDAHHVRFCNELIASNVFGRLEVLELNLETAAAALEDWIRTNARRLAKVPSIVLAGRAREVEGAANALMATHANVTLSAQPFSTTYAIETHEGSDPSDDEDEDEEEYDVEVDAESSPESEVEDDDSETEHEEPGVDEEWEEPKEAPYDIDEPDEETPVGES